MTWFTVILLQVALAKLSWKKGLELPPALSVGQVVVIGKKIYCGGGLPFSRFTKPIDSNVCCYNSVEDNWTNLPPLPVKRFGLGQVSGKLVAVGGLNHDNVPTNELYVYNDLLKRWEQEIPPMPTARCGAGVVSFQSALVVAGGETRERGFLGEYISAMDIVEIFKSDTSQWYKTDRLHRTVRLVSGIAVGNTCYVFRACILMPLRLKKQPETVMYASVDELLHNAVPANQTTHSGSSDTQSAWKTLPSPTRFFFLAELAGNLIAIGTDNQVYMYISSLESWINIGNTPTNEYLFSAYTGMAVANLSPLEIIVLAKNVYKVTPVYI